MHAKGMSLKSLKYWDNTSLNLDNPIGDSVLTGQPISKLKKTTRNFKKKNTNNNHNRNNSSDIQDVQ